MSDAVSMVMPMAGRGSRFGKDGQILPKPLIELAGKPFFYWATLGILRELPQVHLVYVVLQEHVQEFDIGSRVKEYFPSAKIVEVPEVTSGALETVLKARPLVGKGSIIVNDCDHAFYYSRLGEAVTSLAAGNEGFLSHFRSTIPHFSFAAYGEDDLLERTMEKVAISDRAIAGIYGFRDMALIESAAEAYARDCPYPELFVSGLYNEIVHQGGKVRGFDLDSHIPFGTPDEYRGAVTRGAELLGLSEPMK